jgi:hypothetical protein
MKAVCSSTWGHKKETLLITYKALVESVFNYAAAIWYPFSKPININKLKFVQNTTMRLITGCHKAASVGHLLTESKLMPVADHLAMLCSQFLVSCLPPSHPSHEVVLLPPGPQTNKHDRPLKRLLNLLYLSCIIFKTVLCSKSPTTM